MKKAIYAAVIIALLTTGCGATGRGGFRLTQQAGGFAGFGGFDGGTATPTLVDTPMPTDLPSAVPPPTATGTATPQMFPVVTFAQSVVCRKGPGVAYYAVTAYTTGQTAEIDGRNEDASWLWVRMENNRDYCWVFASTVRDFGEASVLSVIPYQALPGNPVVSISHAVCGHAVAQPLGKDTPNRIQISWDDVPGASGYRFYRAGELMLTLSRGTLFAWDYPRTSKSYQYAVEAFNDFGVSQRMYITVPGC